jgi:hypothetical protein
MIPESLLERERRLRRAVERRQYADLPKLLEDMRLIADRHRRPDVARWMRGIIDWARLMVIAQRQIWDDELGCLATVSRYLERGRETPSGVCLDL